MNQDGILKLPDDVLIHITCTYLSNKDIIRFFSACHHLRQLLHHGVVLNYIAEHCFPYANWRMVADLGKYSELTYLLQFIDKLGPEVMVSFCENSRNQWVASATLIWLVRHRCWDHPHLDRCVCSLIHMGGADVNSSLVDRPPLHCAVYLGRLPLTRAMLEYGAGKNFCDTSGRTGISIAAARGFADILSFLISEGANVAQPDFEEKTPLAWAAAGGHVSCLKLLLEAHPDNIDAADDEGWTPLHFALFRHHSEASRYLIQAGANVQAIVPESERATLHIDWDTPTSDEALDIYRMLIERGADIHAVNARGVAPLSLAANYGFTSLVSLLLEHGALVTACDDSNCTPLHYACKNGYLDIINLILQRAGTERDAVLNAPDGNGGTPLAWICAYGSVPCTQHLLKEGAHICLNDEAATPLHAALIRGHSQVLAVLEEHLRETVHVEGRHYPQCHCRECLESAQRNVFEEMENGFTVANLQRCGRVMCECHLLQVDKLEC